MANTSGFQKGPQQHAEGQHGERTHARFQEQLHESWEGADAGEGQRQGTKRRPKAQRRSADAQDTSEHDRQRANFLPDPRI